MDRARRLASLLEQEPIVRAYLFGSQATGRTGPLSDVDVAVLPAAGLTPRERLALQARVASAAASTFGTREADAVLLDEAPPSLAFAAVCGTLLVEKDPRQREVFEARVMREVHDRADREAWWDELLLERYARGEFA